MSQHDFNIGNQLFPATRTDFNNALVALASNSSGATAPATTYANQWWYETDTNILKIRNEANTAWINVIKLDTAMTATVSEINRLDGVTANATEFNKLDGLNASTSELNKLAGLTSSTTELNQLDAITRGSILYGNSSGATARLTKGAADTVLTSNGTDLSWDTAYRGEGVGAEFISSADISNASYYTFTGFDASKYDNYIFYLANVTPADDHNYLMVQTSTNAGSSYVTGGTAYKGQIFYTRNATSVGYSQGDVYTSGLLTWQQGTAAGEEGGASGTLQIFGPHLSQYTRMMGSFAYVSSNANTALINSMVTRQAAEDVNAIRLLFIGNSTSGTIASGTITAYGLKNS